MKLAGLSVQFLGHTGQTGCCSSKAHDRLVQGLDDGAKTGPDQGKISFVVHLRIHPKISVCDPGENLLNIGYVTVDTFQCGSKRPGHDLQFISGVDRYHFCVQITVRKSHHTLGNAVNRTGDGPGQTEDQQDGEDQHE